MMFETWFGFASECLSPSLRGAQRRSNPSIPARRDGLLRFVRNDGEGYESRNPAQFPLRMKVAQLALENLAAGLARQCLEELDVLVDLPAVRAVIDFVTACAREDRVRL